ncbi:Wzz/FepE/Etk N-terminal domain-containing protein [Alkalimonas collagenimarina]|uniref:Wzz/FepE/Etk N-terminal domain-containing protein n=1 Tax=Alkalimonas collagenimarina TaxID=400390 RepID=A0ABT9H121_9GAMM|nr:Wzz/FepE/Etk N-terminal domain-containing protein [Alkalimonas collagenimarina]MDP4536903.1 Wzz/FepE/Etk N-terminal domain-containing protein [Alkalimonas collagenimarina]
MAEQTPTQDVDLAELFRTFWRAKLFIIGFTALFAVGSVFYALSLSDVYRSDALLAPANTQQKPGMGALGQLGGLASLAGVNLGGQGTDKTALALEVLRSRDFIGRLIEQHDLFVPVMAAKDWRVTSNELVLDESIYDASTDTWLRDAKPPRQSKPSVQETYEEFIKLLQVRQSKDNGMVTVSIEHYSPHIAQQWVQLLITELNAFMKQRDMEEARRSMTYLEQQLQKTQVEEIRRALFQLIEEQTKTLMLTQVSDEYVFKIIDPPIASEKKAKPSRALICIIGTLFGGFLACLVVLIRFLVRPTVKA